jgi:hypothetical protein
MGLPHPQNRCRMMRGSENCTKISLLRAISERLRLETVSTRLELEQNLSRVPRLFLCKLPHPPAYPCLPSDSKPFSLGIGPLGRFRSRQRRAAHRGDRSPRRRAPCATFRRAARSFALRERDISRAQQTQQAPLIIYRRRESLYNAARRAHLAGHPPRPLLLPRRVRRCGSFGAWISTAEWDPNAAP